MNERIVEQFETIVRFLNSCLDYEELLEKRAHTEKQAAIHRARAAEYRRHLSPAMKLLLEAKGFGDEMP